MDEKKILITGGQGLLGSNIVNLCLQRSIKVISIDKKINSKGTEDNSCIELQVDVTNYDEIYSIIDSTRPDVIIHTAASLSHTSENDPHQANLLNVMGLSNILEAARVAGVKRVIYASSVSVYGTVSQTGNCELNENSPVIGTNVYAAQKILNECEARAYRKRYGMEISGIRISYIYGPGAFLQRGSTNIMISILNTIASKKSPIVNFPADMEICSQYVGDISYLFVEAALYPHKLEPLYQPGGIRFKLSTLSETISRLYPPLAIRFMEPHTMKPEDLPGQWYDDSLVQQTFPHEYTSLEIGIPRHIMAQAPTQ
ncbi:UDP-glucose 4-epimerase [compost metagenome]